MAATQDLAKIWGSKYIPVLNEIASQDVALWSVEKKKEAKELILSGDYCWSLFAVCMELNLLESLGQVDDIVLKHTRKISVARLKIQLGISDIVVVDDTEQDVGPDEDSQDEQHVAVDETKLKGKGKGKGKGKAPEDPVPKPQVCSTNFPYRADFLINIPFHRFMKLMSLCLLMERLKRPSPN